MCSYNRESDLAVKHVNFTPTFEKLPLSLLMIKLAMKDLQPYCRHKCVILITHQNNSQSYNWILLAHVVIKTARIKGSRASLNVIAAALWVLSPT